MFPFRISFADPIAVRHALEILSELSTKDPYAVAMALGDLIILTFQISRIPIVLFNYETN